MGKHFVRVTVFAFLAALVAASPALAEGAKKSEGGGKEEKKEAPAILHVQLDWFMMPVSTGSGSKRPRTVPGTLFLAVREAADVTPVCLQEPRIRDAILRELFAAPLVAEKGKMDLAGAAPRLLVAINAALDQPRATAAWLVSGIVRKTSKDIKGIPFDVFQSCPDVREAAERAQEKQSKGGH